METAVGHVIVCGLDRLGLRIVEDLRALGDDVVVMADGAAVTFVDRVRDAGARMIGGSSQEEDHLRDAGIEKARCLVLTEDTDLGNLHAAITAQEINPTIRVVVRIFNSELAHRAGDLLTNVEVLALSSLSAPTLVAEALGLQAGSTFEVWGRKVALRESDEGEDAALARLEDGMFLSDGGAAPEVLTISQTRWRGRRTALRALRAFFDRRLAVVLGMVFLLSAISVAIFAVFDHLSPVDAIYFTFTTITTVGYGDINLATSSNALKLYDVGFMLFGATALAAFYALVTDAVVGARLSAALGVPHGKIKNHVVVCGLGNVGFRVVEQLVSRGVEVAACDLNERGRFVQVVRRMGVPVLVGDALLADNLHILGVARARAVVAATNDDVANVEVMLAARELGPGARLVARVFDAKLAERAEKRFGIHACHSVSALAAPYFAAATLGDDVNTMLTAGAHAWLLVERKVGAESPASKMTVRAFQDECDGIVVAVRDSDGARWRPEHDSTIAAGQELLVATVVDGLETLRRLTTAE
ncbi:MAG: NAD-binding protein [Candidatus Dormibacteria bacterium]